MSIDYREYIRKKLNEKGINIQTQDYVIEYIEINQRLYGSFLDIDKVVNRIVCNLNHSIKTKPMHDLLGRWDSFEHKIYIAPSKIRAKPIIMHELDHCATTVYVDMEDDEKERYIETYLNNSASLLRLRKLKKFFNKYFQGSNVKFPICGIHDGRKLVFDNGELNEGITAYKTDKYCEVLGIKPLKDYKIQKMLAQFIAETIGEEKLITMHFNNDYEGIRKAFRLTTGKDLNSLVLEMGSILFMLSHSSLHASITEMMIAINKYRVKKQDRNDGTNLDSHITSLPYDLVSAYQGIRIKISDILRALDIIQVECIEKNLNVRNDHVQGDE